MDYQRHCYFSHIVEDNVVPFQIDLGQLGSWNAITPNNDWDVAVLKISAEDAATLTQRCEISHLVADQSPYIPTSGDCATMAGFPWFGRAFQPDKAQSAPPITKAAFISTPTGHDYDGNPLFVIDTHGYSGASGSLVFFENVPERIFVPLGVFSGTYRDIDTLGLAWRWKIVHDLIKAEPIVVVLNLKSIESSVRTSPSLPVAEQTRVQEISETLNINPSTDFNAIREREHGDILLKAIHQFFYNEQTIVSLPVNDNCKRIVTINIDLGIDVKGVVSPLVQVVSSDTVFKLHATTGRSIIFINTSRVRGILPVMKIVVSADDSWNVIKGDCSARQLHVGCRERSTHKFFKISWYYCATTNVTSEGRLDLSSTDIATFDKVDDPFSCTSPERGGGVAVTLASGTGFQSGQLQVPV